MTLNVAISFGNWGDWFPCEVESKLMPRTQIQSQASVLEYRI